MEKLIISNEGFSHSLDPEDAFGDSVGKVAGFSLHAGVVPKAHERRKLERL